MRLGAVIVDFGLRLDIRTVVVHIRVAQVYWRTHYYRDFLGMQNETGYLFLAATKLLLAWPTWGLPYCKLWGCVALCLFTVSIRTKGMGAASKHFRSSSMNSGETTNTFPRILCQLLLWIRLYQSRCAWLPKWHTNHLSLLCRGWQIGHVCDDGDTSIPTPAIGNRLSKTRGERARSFLAATHCSSGGIVIDTHTYVYTA